TRMRKLRGMAARRKPAPKTRARRGKYWSRRVMETSDALDLEKGVFRRGSARAIASSLKRSAERSKRRKSAPFRSAMSMLVFYQNRAGKNLSAAGHRKIAKTKVELRKLFGKSDA